VSTLEDRLRDAYRAAAETVRPETLTLRPSLPGRDRRSRSRWLVPLAAAAAVIAVVCAVAVLLPRATPGPGTGQASRTTPDYFVALKVTQHPYMFVVNATTGDPGARISLPFSATDLDAVATSDGRTFVVAATQPGQCRTALYRFRLSTNGMPTPITPFTTVAGIVPNAWAMAVSGNGQIAYYAPVCGQSPRVAVPREFLAVVNTVTGQAKRWTFTNPAGRIAAGLSLSADGRIVGYGDVVLDTSAAPGSLADHMRFVPTGGSLPGDLAVAPDGQAAYVVTSRTASDWQLRAFDLATWHTRLVRSFPGTPSPLAAITLDPTGRYLLAQSGWQAEPAKSGFRPGPARLDRLDLATGRVTRLNASWATDSAIAW
jgi:hypothetical protein